ncbi:PREDICTED: ryanodine receptor 1-like, partial [Aptenodytes forsteri]|uniref:ryanodine receptor 1-like n=1 Tax=Aptenodytes forsteri TaxID=9233 RepID=UPI000905A69E
PGAPQPGGGDVPRHPRPGAAVRDTVPAVLGLPSRVEEMCPDIPDLERLMRDIGGLAESGARYTEMPHVIEVTLPMLCNYLPRWWERGPDTLPQGPWATAVTGQHLNALLGNILRIVVNNLGIDEASWMKRLAVFAQPIVSKAKPELLRSHFIPTMEKLKKRAGKVVAEEEQLRMEAKTEGEDAELLIRDEFSVLCRDLYALYPLLIRYVDNSRAKWLTEPNEDAEELFRMVGEVFIYWSKSHSGDGQGCGSEQERTKKKRRGDRYSIHTSLIVATLKKMLPIGLNMCSPTDQELINMAKGRYALKDTDEEVREYLNNNLHLQGKCENNSSMRWQMALYREMAGNVVNGTIARQMVDMLVESSSNVTMILKFFDMFLKLRDIVASDAFRDYVSDPRGLISKKDFQKAMDSQKQYEPAEIQFLLSCSEADENEMIDVEAFAGRFQEPARDIGFNVAVLLTNLSEHVPHDQRLRTFLEQAASILEYFRPFLGRIEIMGAARRIERLYFEISAANKAQWEMPQVKESKRQFIFDVVNEGGEAEKMELFVNFCEDTIFEMQIASRLSEEEPPREGREDEEQEEEEEPPDLTGSPPSAEPTSAFRELLAGAGGLRHLLGFPQTWRRRLRRLRRRPCRELAWAAGA